MKKNVFLITNADDFGLNNSITDAIIDSHVNGIITSTTIMSNMIGTDYAISKAKEFTSLGVGIHFNLTQGKPISEPSKVPLLIGSNGEFNPNLAQRKNFIFGKEVKRQAQLELDNQLIYLLDNGLYPTHFDSHHHITGTPAAFNASLNVVKKYKVNKARTTNIDYVFCDDYVSRAMRKFRLKIQTIPKALIHKVNKYRLVSNKIITPDTKILPSRVLPLQSNHIEQFIKTLSILKKGSTEISFHPGYKYSCSFDSDDTAKLRVRDFKILTSKDVLSFINKQNIQLINFKDLR